MIDIKELGELISCELTDEHGCSANLHPDLDRIIRCVQNADEVIDEWQLHNLHFADEQEVEMGEADFAGEITYHSAIAISYCPFCGEKLSR